ncbi:SCAN domain-containing protein 3 [Trichoplax sp. H2]|nr:SCAN domain-containing protein 3 [Trichoplax sp. H2]|eukprot:RDD36129.1 SCAN domain-containing protein 3 [Trichoplax sp. H2]
MDEELRIEFDTEVAKFRDLKTSAWSLTRNKYNMIANRLQQLVADKLQAKSSYDYHILKRYEVRLVSNDSQDNSLKLFIKGTNKQFVAIEDIFDIIHSIHIQANHGGRNKMNGILAKQYANITRKHLLIYKQLCRICTAKDHKNKRKSVISERKSYNAFSRCQIEVLDMGILHQDDLRYILVYQDQLTNFTKLKALKTNTSLEVADQLAQIICDIGAPVILQTVHGPKFAKEVLDELSRLWPYCRLVYSDTMHSNLQNSVDTTINIVQSLLTTSQSDFEANMKWSIRLSYIQWQINNRLHPIIGRTPYEAMFGCKPAVRMIHGALPAELIVRPKQELNLVQNENEIVSSRYN